MAQVPIYNAEGKQIGYIDEEVEKWVPGHTVPHHDVLIMKIRNDNEFPVAVKYKVDVICPFIY